MPVLVDLTEFHRDGVSLEDAPAVGGKIVAVGWAGVTVRLNSVLRGLDTVTVKRRRVTTA